jgi:6-phosphogluconolactonase
VETFAYVGTFTAGFVGGGGFAGLPPGEGIYVLRLDTASGAMEKVQTVTGLDTPSYLAVHPTLPVLYAVEREWSPDERTTGALTTFAIDERSGQLTQIARDRSGGNWPAHVSVHPSGRFALVANPRGATIACFPLGPDGRPGPIASTARHEGRGPNVRQPAAYAHSVWPDLSGKWALACDLGIDRVMIYRLDEATGQLTPGEQPFAQVSSGAGTRHLAFHPSNRLVYVVNELDSTLSVFRFDPEKGVMEIVQTVYSPPEDFQGQNHGAHAVVHESGNYVYVANRGHDSLSIFAIDQATGKVRLVRHQDTLGGRPRNFNVDPSHQLLLAANQHGPNVTSFRIAEGGRDLVPTGHSVEVYCPVCVVFRRAG